MTMTKEQQLGNLIEDVQQKIQNDYSLILCKRKRDSLRQMLYDFSRGDDCYHIRRLFYFFDQAGRKQFRFYCARCYKNLGSPKRGSLGDEEKNNATLRDIFLDNSSKEIERLRRQREQMGQSISDLLSGQWWPFYNAYLESREWSEKRQTILERDQHFCQSFRIDFASKDGAIIKADFSNCTKHATEVHHLSYDRVTEETDEDLISLCRSCHQQVERYKKALP